jgi:hypothetical protein
MTIQIKTTASIPMILFTAPLMFLPLPLLPAAMQRPILALLLIPESRYRTASFGHGIDAAAFFGGNVFFGNFAEFGVFGDAGGTGCEAVAFDFAEAAGIAGAAEFVGEVGGWVVVGGGGGVGFFFGGWHCLSSTLSKNMSQQC